MEQQSGGPVSLTNPYDCEGSGSRTMLGEREVAQVAPEVGLRAAGAAVSKRSHAGLAAVAASWQLWREEDASSREWRTSSPQTFPPKNIPSQHFLIIQNQPQKKKRFNTMSRSVDGFDATLLHQPTI
eukprot:SAG11_NODE_156_length_14147_cov_10.367597_2_plen_127_part_00